MVKGREPRRVPAPSHRTFYSGIELVEADESNRPLASWRADECDRFARLQGSRQRGENGRRPTEIARRQVRNGAQVIDVCLQSSERDEAKDIPPFYENLIRKIKAPIMIDTTDPASVELALTYCQGKSIINSINLEDGEDKFERVCPLARALRRRARRWLHRRRQVAGSGVHSRAKTRRRRAFVPLARQTKYGIPVENVIIDPLVFPCATGDENYIGGAVETIEAIRLIKENIPGVRTILGISNISFGLPASAREVVNSVFLYYCTKAGLDLAIVNSEKIERFASIPEEERRLAENLLFNTPPAEIPADSSSRCFA